MPLDNIIIYKTKLSLLHISKIILLTALFFCFISFVKSRILFSDIVLGGIISVISMMLLLVLFLYRPIVFYETYFLIKRPILLRFLNPKKFKYKMVNKFEIYFKHGRGTIPSFKVTYNLEEIKNYEYSFSYPLLDKKTISKVTQILKNNNVNVVIYG
jgi:hypothetical protein